MDFFNEDQRDQEVQKKLAPWKIVIVDDEPEVHEVTKLALNKFTLEDRPLSFISAYSGEEGYKLLTQQDDIAIAFIDVVMEADDAGLQLIEKIRMELGNRSMRIILRTGQPGQAPEEEVIKNYDINDYKSKTELTVMRLKSCVYAALRSYRDIKLIEESRQGMERVIDSSTSVLKSATLSQFGSAVLSQTLRLLNISHSAIYLTSSYNDLYNDRHMHVLAATGELVNVSHYSELKYIPDNVRELVEKALETKQTLILDREYVGYYEAAADVASVLYLQHDTQLTQLQLGILELFAANVSLIFDNLNHKEDIVQTQKELIMVMGDAIEARSKETGAHVRRVSRMCELLSRRLNMSDEFVDTIRFAAPLHDIGKIAIPETILHKPGGLDDQEWNEMQTHALRGYQLLASSNRIIAKMGAIIALTHHEYWDGSGYPNGIAGEEIPVEGRIMAIVDVIDALLSKRSYKKPWSVDEVKAYIKGKSGKQFDPHMTALCLELFDDFLAIRTELPDD